MALANAPVQEQDPFVQPNVGPIGSGTASWDPMPGFGFNPNIDWGISSWGNLNPTFQMPGEEIIPEEVPVTYSAETDPYDFNLDENTNILDIVAYINELLNDPDSGYTGNYYSDIYDQDGNIIPEVQQYYQNIHGTVGSIFDESADETETPWVEENPFEAWIDRASTYDPNLGRQGHRRPQEYTSQQRGYGRGSIGTPSPWYRPGTGGIYQGPGLSYAQIDAAREQDANNAARSILAGIIKGRRQPIGAPVGLIQDPTTDPIIDTHPLEGPIQANPFN